MQGCSYDLPAKPPKELQQRATELPDVTTLSQMHIALDYIVCSTLELYHCNTWHEGLSNWHLNQCFNLLSTHLTREGGMLPSSGA